MLPSVPTVRRAHNRSTPLAVLAPSLPYIPLYRGSPSMVPVEQCRLPAVVLVKSLGTDGVRQGGIWYAE